MATDDWGPWQDVPFDHLKPGTTVRSRFELSPDLVAAVRELVDGMPVPTPQPGDPVPPSMYSTFLPLYRGLRGRIEQGTVHSHQSVTMFAPPAEVGDVLDAYLTIVSAESDGRRRPVVVDIDFHDGTRRVCTSRSRYLWGFSAPEAGAR